MATQSIACPPIAKLLPAVFRNPEIVAGFGVRDWETLIWQARSAELLGQLRHCLVEAGKIDLAPAKAQGHLNLAWTISERHRQAVHFELQHLATSLARLNCPVILLKGAAYSAQSLGAAQGRVFNDIDIMVPKERLNQVEQTLLGAGWIPTHLNRYDQRYYRRWMHEIPPMEHKSRSTVLDIHHTIIPPTSGIKPDAAAMFKSALPVATTDISSFDVLAQEEMVIHSACHLFYGEFQKGLRDLFDLHVLVSEFSKRDGFWHTLEARAEQMGLGDAVLDALTQCQRIFGTHIDQDTLKHFQEMHRHPFSGRIRGWIFEQVLRSPHPSASEKWTGFARWLAYARSHKLRMPLPLLFYHLSYKAVAPYFKSNAEAVQLKN